MAWRIEHDGEVYREVDLTIGEVEQMEELAGTTWNLLAPLRSAKHARVILAVSMAHRKGITIDAANETVKALKADAFIDMVHLEGLDEQLDLPSEYEDGIPKAEAEPSTPT